MLKILSLLFLPVLLFAKPVQVDEILTEKKKFRLTTTISYTNIKRDHGTRIPFEYETKNGDFVTIPTYTGSRTSNQDYLGYAFSLSYGLSKEFEIFSSVNLFTSKIHKGAKEHFNTTTNKGFNSLNVGLIYRVKKESKTPSLLFGISETLIDKERLGDTTQTIYAKGYSFFVTSYYTVDPVVFLMKASYRLNLKSKDIDTGKSVNKGDIFSLTPEVYFAVNPYTSMSWGVRYSYHDRNKRDGEYVSASGSDVTYLFGTSYELNAKSTINFDIRHYNKFSTSVNNISFGISHKF